MDRLVNQRHPDGSPSYAPTRKVWAMIWSAAAVLGLLLVCIALRTFVFPDEAALDSVITALGTALVPMIAAVGAAWKTRERDTPNTTGT